MYHWVYHTDIGSFADYDFGVNIVFMQFLMTLGRTGCCIFALITGYFMISRKQENYYPKIISLVGATHLYYLLVLIIMLISKAVPVSLTIAVKYMLPMLFGPWYVIAYVIMLLLIPLINPWLRGLDKKAYLRLIVTLLIIWSVIPTASANAWEFSDIDFFIVMYVLGGYLRLHPTEKKLPWGAMAVASWGFMLLSVIAIDIFGIVTGHRELFDKAFYFGKINSVLAVFLTITIFMWFSKKNIHSPFVNKVAETTLGIYILHNNRLARIWLVEVIFPNVNYVESPYLNVLLKTLAIFFVGAAIETVRTATVGKWFDTAVERKLMRRKNS